LLRIDPAISPGKLPTNLRPLSTAGTEARQFAYGTGTRSTDKPALPADATEFRGLRVLTTIGPNGHMSAEFRFRMRGGRGDFVRLRLPPGATLRNVEIAGRFLDVPPNRDLTIPVSSSSAWTLVEIRYELPTVPRGMIERVATALPEAPFDTLTTH